MLILSAVLDKLSYQLSSEVIIKLSYQLSPAIWPTISKLSSGVKLSSAVISGRGDHRQTDRLRHKCTCWAASLQLKKAKTQAKIYMFISQYGCFTYNTNTSGTLRINVVLSNIRKKHSFAFLSQFSNFVQFVHKKKL